MSITDFVIDEFDLYLSNIQDLLPLPNQLVPVDIDTSLDSQHSCCGIDLSPVQQASDGSSSTEDLEFHKSMSSEPPSLFHFSPTGLSSIISTPQPPTIE
jgi:hypothetical protein